MKLSVGCNWDGRLLEELARFPEVTDVHMLLPRTVIGASGPAWLAVEASDDVVAAFVRRAHELGKTATLVLDAPNMEATEWEPDVHARVLALFGRLQDAGMDCVELAIPYLLELVQARFPKLRTSVSATTRVASVDTVRFVEEMGASVIHPEVMLQRNMKALRELAGHAKGPLQLEALNGTLRGSPGYGSFDTAWTNALLSSDRFVPDFYSDLARGWQPAFDDAFKLRNPVELIRCNFVRPEDVHVYEEAGIQHFKLDCALYPTDDILARVEAYVRRRYDGDLAKLVNLFSFGHRYRAHELQPPAARAFPDGTPPAVAEFFRVWDDPAALEGVIEVNNRALDGFLDHVTAGRCADDGCTACAAFAEAAVRVVPEPRDRFCAALDSFRKVIATGDYLPGPKKG